jgi:hypothetical protein
LNSDQSAKTRAAYAPMRDSVFDENRDSLVHRQLAPISGFSAG